MGPFGPWARTVQAMGERFQVVPCGSQPDVESAAEARGRLHDLLTAPAQSFSRMGQAHRKRVQLLRALVESALELAIDPPLKLLQANEQGLTVRTQHFGGGGRGRRPQIGGKVGDGEIGFMADAGHHRKPAGADGAGDDFLVERPEVLDAAAATAQDDRVAVTPPAASCRAAAILSAAPSPWTGVG